MGKIEEYPMKRTEASIGNKTMLLGGEEYPVVVKIKDILAYVKAVNRVKKTQEDGSVKALDKADVETNIIELSVDIAKELLMRGNKRYSEEDVEELLLSHFSEVAQEVPVALGIAKREDVEAKEVPKN